VSVSERVDRRAPDSSQRAGGIRRDIQGLRAIAVGAVVLFHLWPQRLPGGFVGVDVFFVISGFLITSHLLARPPRRGGDLTRFWARRIRRLLPASLLVLAVTLVATWLVAPVSVWDRTAREAIAAAFYVENWSLAAQSVDYLAADAAPTAVQHFWSLSVEEQFYLVWPILLLGAGLLARRLRRSELSMSALAVGIVLVASFIASIVLTATQPERAYFLTWTRAWEFAVGAAGAWAVLALRRPGPVLAAVLAWSGLALIVVSCFQISATTPFPGWAAAFPVLGTAAVLVARAEGRGSPDPLWRLPGAQWLGDASYSVYLWHWPLIVLAAAALGGTIFWPVKVAVLAATLLLSALTKVHVEDRFRRPRPGQRDATAFRGALAGMLVVSLLAGLLVLAADRRSSAARDELASVSPELSACLGAASLAPDADCPDPWSMAQPWYPDPSIAGEDQGDAYADDCFTGSPYTARLTCTYGDGPYRVALVGNSHAGHWLPALQVLAEERDWTLTTFLVSVCNISDAPTEFADPAVERNCLEYTDWVVEQTSGDAFDLVITSQRQSARVAGEDWAGTAAASEAGYRSLLERWVRAGARVAVIEDVHNPTNEVGRIPECLDRNRDDPAQCTWPQQWPAPDGPDDYRWMDPLYAAAQSRDDVETVSVNDLLCRDGVCNPVIGLVVTYVDASHLTATYARSLAPALDERLAPDEAPRS
jgi:peptidoglycan/LPS O-acetylase OafA/YrhL